MRYVMALLLLAGCEGLDLDSSAPPHPVAERRMLSMSISVLNDNDAELRLYLRTEGGEQAWSLDVPANQRAVAHFDCAEGDLVCRVFEIRPTGAPDWGRQQCSPCGSGNLSLTF